LERLVGTYGLPAILYALASNAYKLAGQLSSENLLLAHEKAANDLATVAEKFEEATRN
jgi:hypothetical protein